MWRVLFVSNGHGEAAIADRIAEEVRAIDPGVQCDHLALVGRSRSSFMNDVGPQRAMPSGGLIAMGNLRNIARDLSAGLLWLTVAQRGFLARSRGQYDRVVCIGDVFALLMSLTVRAPVTYVGTAKSVRVAPYGRMERRALRRAANVFVRDDATAQDLRAHGVDASAPGNVIVDLFASEDDPRAGDAVAGFVPALALFPGSRDSAYDDAAFLLDVLADCARRRGELGGVLSMAPQLDAEPFPALLREHGYEVVFRAADERIPFEVRTGGRVLARAWRGAIGPLLSRVQLVLGQAGTANEAAAAAGVPVVAFERGHDRRTAWYRMRQHGLLGDALEVLPGDRRRAATAVGALLDDPARRVRMGSVGRENMGAPGGARAIARSVVEQLH
jgi:uncharacterized protein (TIGR03492 family)